MASVLLGGPESGRGACHSSRAQLRRIRVGRLGLSEGVSQSKCWSGPSIDGGRVRDQSRTGAADGAPDHPGVLGRRGRRRRRPRRTIRRTGGQVVRARANPKSPTWAWFAVTTLGIPTVTDNA